MKKIYLIEDFTINVSFGKGIVHIANDEALLRLISVSLEDNSAKLVGLIKKDYFKLHEKELQISDHSLIVEIWGHVYFEYFTSAVSRILPLKPVEKFGAFVTERCDVIDSGEAEVDSNRKFWDILATYKGLLAKLLPTL